MHRTSVAASASPTASGPWNCDCLQLAHLWLIPLVELKQWPEAGIAGPAAPEAGAAGLLQASSRDASREGRPVRPSPGVSRSFS
jgi:hypothetical protein